MHIPGFIYSLRSLYPPCSITLPPLLPQRWSQSRCWCCGSLLKWLSISVGGQTGWRAPVDRECALETSPLGRIWSPALNHEKRSQHYFITTGAERGKKAKISTKTAQFLMSPWDEAGGVVAINSFSVVPWQSRLFANIKKTVIGCYFFYCWSRSFLQTTNALPDLPNTRVWPKSQVAHKQTATSTEESKPVPHHGFFQCCCFGKVKEGVLSPINAHDGSRKQLMRLWSQWCCGSGVHFQEILNVTFISRDQDESGGRISSLICK